MKNYLTIILLFFSSFSHSQKNTKLTFSVVDHFSLGIPIESMFNCYKLKVGFQLSPLELFATYDYGGQYDPSNTGETGMNGYNYHQIGGGFKYYMIKSDKFKPYVGLEASSQVGTNYKNGLLRREGLPTAEQSPSSLQKLSSMHGQYFGTYEEYHLWIGNVYYQSTSFIGTFLIGFDVKMYKGLHLNFGVGAGMRNIKVEVPINKTKENHFVFSADAQLGLSYAIPLKKEKDSLGE